ncbi:MarR family winged helix-turn-helix transcriptional regulator [Luteipulveratus mongoliensis]|uniref:MarR family transcriptional regulator n=1 Tax=Luteipulveratus mongoliensis TaxID=571913 RepID=A0A0K1JEB6_9MICO|nr:MarR family transcriptional regulator [Luteipulveratus mongoliensis]AKU15057.1 MarR family transcriptional regulator [Luteipulveratus mongoliensis]
MSSKRATLIDDVLAKSRELSTETVMFHTAIAEKRGLSAVESKICDYLARLGPLTPKDLAEFSGLAPASVTALTGRLESKGLIKRKPHPDDRRKVLIEFDMTAVAAAAPLWDHIVAATTRACERYSEEQLETVIDFIGQAIAITHESTAMITDPEGAAQSR